MSVYASGSSAFSPEQQAILESAHNQAVDLASARIREQYEERLRVQEAQLAELRHRVPAASANQPAVGNSSLASFRMDKMKPESLHTDGKNWEDFGLTLQAFAAAQSEQLGALLESAEEPGQMATALGSHQPDVQQGLRSIYYSLLMLTKGVFLKIVKSIETKNGFEAYRLLCRRRSPKSKQKNWRVQNIIKWDFGKSPQGVLDNLVHWENAIEEWEKRSGETLPTPMKIAVLDSQLPRELQMYLRLHVEDSSTYEEVKMKIENYYNAEN